MLGKASLLLEPLSLFAAQALRELGALAGSTGGAVLGGPWLHLKGSSTQDPDPRGHFAQPPSISWSPFPCVSFPRCKAFGALPFFFIFWKRKAEGIIKPLKPARTWAAGLPAKVTRVKKIKSRVSQHIKPETVPCHMPSIRPAPSPPAPKYRTARF